MEDLADGIKTKSLTNALESLTEQVWVFYFFCHAGTSNEHKFEISLRNRIHIVGWSFAFLI